MTENETRSFDVIIETRARAVGKMRNEVTVHPGNSDKVYEFATDEGRVHGGEETAPPPLAYFAAGLITCLMTQIRTFSKRLGVTINDVSITGKCHWRGTMKGRGPYETEPVGFDFDIDIDSEASVNDLKRLIDVAKKGCFIEQTLGRQNDIGHRLKVGDGWIEV